MSYLHALSKLIVHGDTFIGVSNEDFPANPKPRQLSVVAGTLYFYSTIDGVTDWFPLTKAKDSYVHIQSGPNTEWVINHNLNREDFLFFVYDDQNLLQIVEPTEITLNSFKVKFTAPKTGRCLVFIDSSSHVQKKLSDLYEFVAETRKSIEDTIWPKISGIDVSGLSTSIDSGRNISFLSNSGNNNFLTVIDGKLYSACGKPQEYAGASGIEPPSYTPVYGVADNLRQVNIPTTSPIKKVIASWTNFVLLENGELYGWGDNGHGQLGLGHTNFVNTPVLCSSNVVDVYGERQIDFAGGITFFIKKDNGMIYGCGYNGHGQLGLGNITTFYSNWTQIASLGTAISKMVNIGGWSFPKFAFTTDGRILATGYNGQGAIGRGNTTQLTTFTDVTTNWAGSQNTTVKDVTIMGTGLYNGITPYKQTVLMFITLNDDTKIIRVCGSNELGQLGNGSTTASSVPSSPQTLDPSKVENIVCNAHGFLAKYTTGEVYAWGNNTYGRLGNGTTAHISTPVLVATNVAKIIAGSTFYQDSTYARMFIIKNDGKLYTSGLNDGGYCGIGYTTPSASPVTDFNKPVLLPFNETVVDIGGFSSNGSGEIMVAKTNANNLYVWGNNNRNGISMNAADSISTPQMVNLP